MKPLRLSDFRARRFMLEKKDFAVASARYQGPTKLVSRKTWRSIIGLPDDVSIRTSDKYGPEIEQMWECWGMWGRVVLGIQDLSKDPRRSPAAIAACDSGDEFQAATYCALVGYYRVAFSCLRNVLEQLTIAVQLEMSKDPKTFADWRNGDNKLGFGWAADMLPKNATVAALQQHLEAATGDSLFNQNPKGFARRLFSELSKYTHGAAGFTDSDYRKSNGPIFVPNAFLKWCSVALRTYALALHELKLVHPRLDKLPWGPPSLKFDDLRRDIVRYIPQGNADVHFLRSLVAFWP
jgi:hypothetical protein